MLKRLTTKPSSRLHTPKRSDPPKPVSCSSPTTGTTPTPYGHRYSAYRPPSSPVDDVLHRIASRFPPSEVDERLIVRSRTSYPMQLISLTDLKLRPIRCPRSGFPLAESSPEMPSVLEIPSEMVRGRSQASAMESAEVEADQWMDRRRPQGDNHATTFAPSPSSLILRRQLRGLPCRLPPLPHRRGCRRHLSSLWFFPSSARHRSHRQDPALPLQISSLFLSSTF